MEVFRHYFGLDYGIETSIVKDDGEKVVVKALITLNDKVVGSGLAEEVRGRVFANSPHVNETSAIENCETSAIGRALSSLGLHGGEYASINEIEKSEEIRKYQEEEKEKEQQEKDSQQPAQEIEDDPDLSPEENAWHKISMRWIKEINNTRSQAQLLEWSTKNYDQILKLQAWDKANNQDLSGVIELQYDTRKEELENGEY
jgi:hypothetical protein